MSKVLYREVPSGGTAFAMTKLTDDGDHQTYNYTGGYFLSAYVDDAGNSYAPTVRVDGVISGGVVIPAVSGTDNLVDVSAMAAYIAGVDLTGSSKVAADTDLACTRGAGASTAYIINSIICDSAGTFSVLTGTGSTAFDLSGARGGAGQPPVITVDKIEVAQVRFTSATAAAVLASEIKMIPNDTREMAKSPGGKIDYARVDGGSLEYPGYTTNVALSAIHTGGVTRGVWMSGYSANFAEWNGANNVQFQGESISSTSVETYTSTSSYTSSEVADGSFDWTCESITDDSEWDVISQGKDAKLWLKLYENRSATNYLACQAVVSGVPTVPASGPITTSLTLSGGTKFLRIVG